MIAMEMWDFLKMFELENNWSVRSSEIIDADAYRDASDMGLLTQPKAPKGASYVSYTILNPRGRIYKAKLAQRLSGLLRDANDYAT